MKTPIEVLQEKKIVMLVHAPQGTLGDPSAAKKMANFWKDSFPGINVEILVVNVDEKYVSRIEGTMGDYPNYKIFKRKEVNAYQDNMEIKNYLDNLAQDSDLLFFCAYPTPHFLQGMKAKMISQWCEENHLPIISMPEYNHDAEYNKQKNKYVSSIPGCIINTVGFGDNNIGVFCNPITEEMDPDNLDNVAEKDKGLIDLLLSDIDIEGTQQKKWDIYRKEQGLWFGYFNRIIRTKSVCKPTTYTEFALKASEQKNIDIIMPVEEFPSKNLAIENTWQSFLDESFYSSLEPHEKVLISHALLGYPLELMPINSFEEFDKTSLNQQNNPCLITDGDT